MYRFEVRKKVRLAPFAIIAVAVHGSYLVVIATLPQIGFSCSAQSTYRMRRQSVHFANRFASITDEMEYSQVWNPEEMAGNMILLGTNKVKQPVQVKVYRTSIEHFAVVYPQKKVCRPLGVLNLKNTMVKRLPCSKQPGFTVQQCGWDAPLCSLTFLSESGKELDRWISAFTGRSGSWSRTSSSLPVVEEGEES